MTAKQYLSQLLEMEQRIKRKTDKRNEILYRASSTSRNLNPDRVQTSKVSDRMEDIIITATDMLDDIWKDFDELVWLQNTIINQIQELNNVKYMKILFEYYVRYKQFDKISKEMGNSYYYVINLHKKALTEFERVHTGILEEIRTA